MWVMVNGIKQLVLAERVGFEPTKLLSLLVFKTSSLNHSDTTPYKIERKPILIYFYKKI